MTPPSIHPKTKLVQGRRPPQRLHRIPYALLVALAAVLAHAQTAVANDFTVDRLLASQCAQCHGTDGYAVGGFEELAGEGFADLYDELVEMKMEDNPNDIMEHQALGYTDDQLYRIASYFASLPENEEGDGGEEEADD